jgi:UDP-galactopyranose mutase
MQRSPAREAHDGRPSLLCFSHLRWSFVHQRPQHLMSRAAKTWHVHVLEEPVADDSESQPHLDRRTTDDGVEVLVPVLPRGLEPAAALEAQKAMLDALLPELEKGPIVGWYYTPMALEFSNHVRFPVTVYDCMDELSLFKGAAPALLSLERELMGRADLVFTGGRALYEAKADMLARHGPADRRTSVHCFPSSVDTEHFRPAREGGLPAPHEVGDLARPRILWFGVIDERIDLALIDGVAAARPDWQLVMIGPVVKIDQHSLPRRRNIHWLGMKSYDELPRYLANADIGWMPFAINDATRFISPTKTPEFLAAGLPVVSTPVRDVVRGWGDQGLVAIATDVSSTVAAFEATMSRGTDPDWLARVDAELGEMSWNRTWAAMNGLIEAQLAGADRTVPA